MYNALVKSKVTGHCACDVKSSICSKSSVTWYKTRGSARMWGNDGLANKKSVTGVCQRCEIEAICFDSDFNASGHEAKLCCGGKVYN